MEIWKRCNLSKDYEISSFGRVKSYAKTSTGIILKQFKNRKKYPYYQVRIKNKVVSVHRLIAIAFIQNPDNLPEIDHIDGNTSNNHVVNLRWCSHRENTLNPITIEKGKRFGVENKKSKPINQYDLAGEFIKKWDCINDIERCMGINSKNIIAVAKNRRKSAGGYYWNY